VIDLGLCLDWQRRCLTIQGLSKVVHASVLTGRAPYGCSTASAWGLPRACSAGGARGVLFDRGREERKRSSTAGGRSEHALQPPMPGGCPGLIREVPIRGLRPQLPGPTQGLTRGRSTWRALRPRAGRAKTLFDRGREERKRSSTADAWGSFPGLAVGTASCCSTTSGTSFAHRPSQAGHACAF